MGMNLSIFTQVIGAPEDLSWCGSSHGLLTMDPVTLVAAQFAALFPSGVVPSGVVLGKVTATGKYAPYTSVATYGVGTDTPVYILGSTVDFSQGQLLLPSASWTDTSAAAMFHGQVIIAKLPTNNGYTAAVKTALPLISFV
jgi:hypothetical protein